MQQIYRGTPMLKYDFNKVVAQQLNHLASLAKWLSFRFCFFFHFFHHNFFIHKKDMEHWSKIYSNFSTLKSLTKKFNYLNHIKWHRRCKSLTFNQTNTWKSCYKRNIKVFKKVFDICSQILAKKSLGSINFSWDGRVTSKIHIFFGLGCLIVDFE